ncbi:MAG: cbb3-type cytochrome c oxidase subunit 3 [Deltaproteobacteria bacterium]|nr:cbb3-type cytochrome c oxidase subunit 3 [Deltaproteobacteria bacterium]
MNSLIGHFSTNWSRLTTNDWIGLSATVIIFMLMTIAYAYTFRSKNREKLEAHRFIIMNEDSSYKEDKNG